MSHEGAARVWHVQPRVVIFPCRTNYRVSYVLSSDQLQESWIICKLKSFSPLHLHDLILKTEDYSVCLERYAISVIKILLQKNKLINYTHHSNLLVRRQWTLSYCCCLHMCIRWLSNEIGLTTDPLTHIVSYKTPTQTFSYNSFKSWPIFEILSVADVQVNSARMPVHHKRFHLALNYRYGTVIQLDHIYANFKGQCHVPKFSVIKINERKTFLATGTPI